MWEVLELPRLSGPAQRGDLVEIQWRDIVSDSNGDPKTASLYHRVDVGYYWEERNDADGTPILVTTPSQELNEEFAAQTGYTAYPMSCVKKINIIRRGRKGKKNASI